MRESLIKGLLSRFDNFPGTQTTGADPYMYGVAALGSHSDALQIGQPAPPVFIMGMADIVACHRPLTAYFAFLCHDLTPYYIGK